MKYIILIGLCILVLGCEELELNTSLRIEDSTCYVQDNSNYSRWCEINCSSNLISNLIEGGMKCMFKEDRGKNHLNKT